MGDQVVNYPSPPIILLLILPAEPAQSVHPVTTAPEWPAISCAAAQYHADVLVSYLEAAL